MNGWYQIKEANTGIEAVINLDMVQLIANDNGNAVFIMSNVSTQYPSAEIKSVEKYDSVIRKLFGPDEPEEGEDDGKPREDPSGFGGMLPM